MVGSYGTGVTHVSHTLGMYVVHIDTGRQNTHTFKYYIYMGVYMHIYTHINTLDFILCLIHEKILDAMNEHSFIKWWETEKKMKSTFITSFKYMIILRVNQIIT